MRTLVITYDIDGNRGELHLPDLGEDADVWACLDRYDADHGTQYWDLLTTDGIVDVRSSEEEYIPPVKTVAAVTRHGTSLGLNLTGAIRQLGADEGEFVKITLERL